MRGRGASAIVIGGGFFGLSIATYLKQIVGFHSVTVIEKEPEPLSRASYNNQARVHNGYHYPRSLLTALRSRINFPKFTEEYRDAIVNDFQKYYAVAGQFSKVSAEQFQLFCQRIDADINEAPQHVKELFDPYLVDNVFSVKEYAFDADKLRKIVLERAHEAGVKLIRASEVSQIQPTPGGGLMVKCADGSSLAADSILNCAYSQINKINSDSHLPVIRLKHELAEMSLIRLPNALSGISATIMCGPFFSFMPFPSQGLTTLSHVRYTPHHEWHDSEEQYRDAHALLDAEPKQSNFSYMLSDAQRYVPALAQSEYVKSLWEVKTILPESEGDDSRPILLSTDHGIDNYHCIMGAKIDNIYDVYKELDLLYA